MTYIPTQYDTVTYAGRTSIYTAAGFAGTRSIHLNLSSTAASAAYMLVDLSDTTNWVHTNTGYLVVEYVFIEVAPADTYSGSVKIGYLKNVDATNGDFVNIFNIDMVRKSGIVTRQMNLGTNGLHCSDAQHFGPITANSTLFQTDTNLQGPDNNVSYPSGNGDLVMLVTGGDTGGVNVSVTIGYESVAA